VFGRLTRFAGVADDGSLELYLRLVRERVLPVVRAIPGFSGYLALSDGERAEVLVLTLWASEQQMLASEETTVQLLKPGRRQGRGDRAVGRAVSCRHQRAQRRESLRKELSA
jgi:heme-degrading monooxygenase HmoA